MARFHQAAANSTQGVESQFSELQRQTSARVAQQTVRRLRAPSGAIVRSSHFRMISVVELGILACVGVRMKAKKC